MTALWFLCVAVVPLCLLLVASPLSEMSKRHAPHYLLLTSSKPLPNLPRPLRNAYTKKIQIVVPKLIRLNVPPRQSAERMERLPKSFQFSGTLRQLSEQRHLEKGRQDCAAADTGRQWFIIIRSISQAIPKSGQNEEPGESALKKLDFYPRSLQQKWDLCVPRCPDGFQILALFLTELVFMFSFDVLSTLLA